MIVLHAAVLDTQIFLWGERPAEPQTMSRSRSGGRKPKVLKPLPHPFDGGAQLLKSALAESGLLSAIGKLEPQERVLWAPSIKGTPLPSTPLIAEPPEARDGAQPAPWKISVFALSPAGGIELLSQCMDKPILAQGVIIGKDLGFLSSLLRFASTLVARQQFLPGLVEREKEYFAVWEPVLSGLEQDRLNKLAGAMPSACRALSNDPSSPVEVPAISVLSDFIGSLVDQMVRSSASDLPQIMIPARKIPRRAKPSSFPSIHDQWLYALRSDTAKMEGRESDLAQFYRQVREWRRPVALSAPSAFRLCFRLEEPEADEGTGAGKSRHAESAWKVRYLLQAADDPSLLVPAETAWSAKGRKAGVLKRGEFNAREYLLAALGQASGICPNIESSLRTSAPHGYSLDTMGAYEFLIQKAWALEQAGFGVLLPAWWTRKGTKQKITARAKVKSPKMQGGGRLSLEEIVHFDWEVAIGDETLTLAELRMLAKLKSPLVKLRGQWVQVNAEEIEAALEFWKKKGAGEATVREVIQLALGAEKSYGSIPFQGVRATGWIKDVLDQLEGREEFKEIPAPEGFRGTLRPYQVRGYSWLSFLREWGLGACLADDMGLGKTIQTLALVEKESEANGRGPVLLICPMSVVNNWQKEAERFTPDLPVMIHHGSSRARGRTFKAQAGKHSVVISSYALLHRDFETLKTVKWAGLVLDEAQNIKNSETRQAKAARALEAEYRIALTGTPVENNVGDLWSIMEFLNPGFLGTQAEFKRSFFIPIQANHEPEAAERLKRLTGPFILRRLKTDKAIIADLPDKMEMKVFCSLTKEQASLYEAVAREAAEALDSTGGIQRKGIVLATLSKLKQVCNHPAQFLGDNSPVPARSGKLARLSEMLEEILETGDRALVFSQFSEMGELLKRYLQETFGREVLFLHGGIAKKQRDRMVERFQNEENGPRVFVLSLKAGGTGLNLTNANHVFHFDRWWNPAVENQATDRAFRIGQTRNVQVHKFICAGTLEEKIDEMIESKKEVSERVVGTGEGWLTELSTVELKSLFALSKDAVAE
jgi:SNF2 family DNA or RNA helicase